jgi:hypothetical protein
MATIGAALILDLILGVVAVVRLLSYGVGSLTTLTGTFILIDIIILSIMIIGFFINIAVINTTGTVNVQELLLRTKKEKLNDISCTMEDKNAYITYLTTMTEQLAANRKRYSITIFGFVIDNAFVLKIVLTLTAQAIAAGISMAKKDIKGA